MTPLTPEEIESLRIAIAEECGWKYQPYRSGEPATWIRPNGNPVGHTLKELPYYTTSIDAIQKAAMERFKREQEGFNFAMTLSDIAWKRNSRSFAWQLSALDWSIAYARTAKIWRFKV